MVRLGAVMGEITMDVVMVEGFMIMRVVVVFGHVTYYTCILVRFYDVV